VPVDLCHAQRVTRSLTIWPSNVTERDCDWTRSRRRVATRASAPLG
jgi:hypothetical protein